MDISQRQNKPAHLDINTKSNPPNAKHPKPSGPEQELARWPLQAVDDNTGAARPKVLEESGDFNHYALANKHVPATYHPPLRTRRGLDESGFGRGQAQRSCEDEKLTYERRTRSYRDTTSEIISLYAASKNALSHNTATARSDDDGSSTASYSRYPASQRHLQSSCSHLQTPNWPKSRTPAPYPTRLRRPGASVTSPTMMDGRNLDSNRMAEYERIPHKTAHSFYKNSLANSQRRAPPLSLRADMNKSSSSLPSGSSLGTNHYRTASGRARTPSSTVSWASRPSDRYYMGSTDQSTRSASLTSIVEMYQRPMTASSTCPAIRPSGTLYYDYSEEFSNPTPERIFETEMPLSPIPHRAGGSNKPVILRQDSDLKVHDALDTPVISTPAGVAYRCGYGQADSSNEGSFDSYLQGSHDDSIEEIERVIANAISNAAADKLMAAPNGADMYPDAFRYRQGDGASNTAHAGNEARRLVATERQYAIKPANGNTRIGEAVRRASQASINRNAIALDPAFADFTSLLSSFERLAKSPFSRLSDEDDIDERESKRSSRISAMETLNETEAMDRPYQKRHRRNAATARVSTPALSMSESIPEQQLSSGEGTLILTPEPLSPNRQKKVQNDLHQKCMKALPPLPAEQMLGMYRVPVIGHSTSNKSRNDSGISQVRSTSLRSHISRSSSPGKLRLRIHSPSSSGDTEPAVASNGVMSERRSADHERATSGSRPPPKLRLKISRNKLGHGRSTQTGSVIRNNRLKQCNALADVAQPPRIDIVNRANGMNEATTSRDDAVNKKTLEEIHDERCSPGGSCQPSDQFNLSYPPTPVQSADAVLPRSGSSKGSVNEVQTVQSEIGDVVSRRLKPKLSLLRLRPGNLATPAALVKPAACAACNDGDFSSKLMDVNVPGAPASRFDTTMNNHPTESVSVKSERVGSRVKRWASDAKRAVRSYVRRTLVRSAKSTATKIE